LTRELSRGNPGAKGQVFVLFNWQLESWLNSVSAKDVYVEVGKNNAIALRMDTCFHILMITRNLEVL
jgi:hypothetical protein